MPRGAALDPEGPIASRPIHAAVGAMFRHDQDIREALSENLKARSVESMSLRERADRAFAAFTPSAYPAAERAEPSYYGRGDDLARSMEAVHKRGARARGDSQVPRSIRLRPSEALRKLIRERPAANGGLVGTIGLGDLIQHIAPRVAASPALAGYTALTACKAEAEAEKRLRVIEQPANGGGAAPVAAGETTTGGDAEGVDATTAQLVRASVSTLMETATSPETRVLYAVPPRSDAKTLQQDITTFELRSGPSDVTSYHDFNSLQIAFEHVWTEIFDGRLAALGRELYHEYVKLKVFSGLDDGTDRSIETLDDLAALMEEVRQLGQITYDDTPGDVRPPASAAGGSASGSTTDAVDYVKAVLDPASLITGQIGDETVRAIVDPAGAIIDGIAQLVNGKPQLNWDSFPGPLPVNGDVIRVTFESDVVPAGTVEIAIASSASASTWKGIEFQEYDTARNLLFRAKISNDPDDRDVWDPARYNVVTLRTAQLRNGLLDFARHGMFGIHTGFYVMGGLDQRLKDRMRVTFTWERDR